MDAQPATPTPQEVGLYYDRMGEVLTPLMGGTCHYGYWEGPDDNSSFEEAAERLTEIMIRKLDVGPGNQVLDLGCGRGKPAIQLARATGAKVIGISVSANDVKTASELAQSEGLSQLVSFQLADAMNLPFPAESFDAVLALESVQHMPDRELALRQVSRVLRPGGRLVLSDFFQRFPVPAESRPVLDRLLEAWKMGSLPELEDYPHLIRAAGLETTELINVSEHTKYSFARLGEVYRQAGQELATAVDSWQPHAGPPKVGYLIAVASRM